MMPCTDSRLQDSKATPKPEWTSSTFDCWYGFIFFEGFILFCFCKESLCDSLKSSTLVSSVQQDILPKDLGLFRCVLAFLCLSLSSEVSDHRPLSQSWWRMVRVEVDVPCVWRSAWNCCAVVKVLSPSFSQSFAAIFGQLFSCVQLGWRQYHEP